MNETTAYHAIKPQWDILYPFLHWLQKPGSSYAIFQKTGENFKPLTEPIKLVLADYFGLDLQMLEAEAKNNELCSNQRTKQFFHNILRRLYTISQSDEQCNKAIYVALKYTTNRGNVVPFPVNSEMEKIPDYTGDLKSAASLFQQLLPEWHWTVVTNGLGTWVATISTRHRMISSFGRPTREIALLVAIFALLEEQMGAA